MNEAIHSIDYIIIAAYFLLVFGIGFAVARKNKTGEDLFLGGRTFTWGIIGLSLFASNISSSTIIGLSSAAYSTGVVNSVYEWMSGVPMIIAAVVFIPLYLKSKITTIPEFLEYRFDARSRVYFSVITIIMSVVIELAGGLYAGAIVLKLFFPTLSLEQIIWIVALVAAVYTAFGGLRAVVYTDAIQAVILIIGCTIMTIMIFGRLDYSWANVLANVPEGHFSMVRPADDETLPWTGLMLGVPLMGFWYWTTNQFIVQRVLGSKDIKQARWGVMLAGFLKILPLFIMVLPGAMAIGMFSVEDNDQIFPTMMVEILPVGLLGLVLAGLISAVMSSVDSMLNSASTLIVVDFIEPYQKEISEQQKMNYGRIITFVFMVIAAIWAPFIKEFPSLWDYLQQMFSIVVPPIAVIFLVGVFYKRGNGAGALATLVFGTLFGVLLFYLDQQDMWHLHYTENVGLIFAVSTLVFILVSLATKAPNPEQVAPFTFRRELITAGMEGVKWYQDYRLQAILLVALMAYILVLFW